MIGLEGALVAASAMGIACAILSVFVVLRRWAFIGEGIAHAGFGGAGTAWVLSLLLPSAALLQTQAGIYLVAVAFCLAVGLGIAAVTRRQQVYPDTAIGIFLVTSLAWGFIAHGMYTNAKQGVAPPGWGDLLMGHMRLLPPQYVLAAMLICAVVVLVAVALGKEIVYYCFDPGLAEVSGVRVGFVHYLLMVLLTIAIVMGMRMMGSLLVTALLVLPGATGLLVSRRMSVVVGAAIAVGLIGAVAGTLINAAWPCIPEGPAIVLALVAQFAGAYLWRRAVGRTT
jgi:ABC-type Mn2+/Zn2+ transport system permease subunit